MSREPVFLYVEDDMDSRDVMYMMLELQIGLSQLTMFEDSHNILSRVKALVPQPDIIFLDIHMKPYNGFEILAMLRAEPQYRQATIVALTASVMNEEVKQLQHVGFNGVIAKPLDPDIFPNLLDRLLRGEQIWHIAEG